MPRLDVPKSIERIIVLHPFGTTTIHRGKNGRRKGSKQLKPYAKYARTNARASMAQADTMLRLITRSDAKKKDGWLKDSQKNQRKAQRKSAKVWRRAYR